VTNNALSDAAWRRLIHYCRRAADGPPEYVHRADAMPQRGGINVRYTNRQLRGIIWADTEVRDALLDVDFDELATGIQQRGCHRGLDLLDLASAMRPWSRTARQRPLEAPAGHPTSFYHQPILPAV
jgi:hypothetical protein